MRLPRLHVVTDDSVLAREDFTAGAAQVLEAGGPRLALHVRGPASSGRRIHEAVRTLQPFSVATGSELFVNDRVDVALAARELNVHLGRRSISARDARKLLGPEARVGLSCHSVAEVERAAPDGADYVFMGTIYPTASHPEVETHGPQILAETRGFGVPVVAIGGIQVEHVCDLVAAGAHGVAVVSGVWDADDSAQAVDAYASTLEAAAPGEGTT